MARWWQEQALQTKLMIIAVILAALALPPAYAGLQSHPGSAPSAASNHASASEETAAGLEITTPTMPPNNPTPNRASLPYAADWSGGMGGWAGAGDWKVLDGMLVNDGTLSSGWYEPIIAPIIPGSTADYAAEAEIKVTQSGSGSFGIVVRSDGSNSGYAAGVVSDGIRASGIGYLSDWHFLVHGRVFAPGSDWHTYRVEVRSNAVTLFVDGTVLAQVTDNRYLNGGQVGLWCNESQIEVRRFTVTAL